MISDKLKIYGDSTKAELVRVLVKKCSEKLCIDVQDTKVYLPECSENFSQENDAWCYVVDYKDSSKLPDNTKMITCSLSDSRADVVALNIQKRTHSVCFELLNGNFMSRIFIPLTSEHTPATVLLSCGVLILWSTDTERIVETINELLK